MPNLLIYSYLAFFHFSFFFLASFNDIVFAISCINLCVYYYIFNRLYEEDLPFEAHLKVRLIDEQRTAQVEFRNTFQPTGRNLSLCTLHLPIPTQYTYSMVSRIFKIGNLVLEAKSCLNFPEGHPIKFYTGRLRPEV